MKKIYTKNLFNGERFCGAAMLGVLDGKIAKINQMMTPPEDVDVYDIITPGFVDLQVNGGGDVLLNNDVSFEAVERIVAAHRAYGTTSIVPTLITDHASKLQTLAEIAPLCAKMKGVAGLHVEGPVISKEKRGVHAAEFIRPLEERDVELLLNIASFLPLILTLAPEVVEPSQIRRLSENGVIVSLGHSMASVEEGLQGFEAGASMVTHLYNAMSQFTARAPGLVGATFKARPFAGIIADGHHVHMAAIEHAFQTLGEKAFLVSDAMAITGGKADEFTLYGDVIKRENGRLIGPDGQLAGADLNMLGALQYLYQNSEISLEHLLRAATHTPVRAIGQGASIGTIQIGADANLIALNSKLELDLVLSA